MRFSLGDGQSWSVRFDADGARELRREVARAWDRRIDQVRLDDGAAAPAFALAARLREIREWIAERRARPDATSEKLRAWEGQASAWEHRARAMYGGTAGELRLSVWIAERWVGLSVSGSVAVPRNLTDHAAVALWARATRLAAHESCIAGLSNTVATIGAQESPFEWLASWGQGPQE